MPPAPSTADVRHRRQRGHQRRRPRRIARGDLVYQRGGQIEGQVSGSATGTGVWSLTAPAGKDATAGTGSHGRERLQHPYPATRARADPHAMITTCFRPAQPSIRDFAEALSHCAEANRILFWWPTPAPNCHVATAHCDMLSRPSSNCVDRSGLRLGVGRGAAWHSTCDRWRRWSWRPRY